MMWGCSRPETPRRPPPTARSSSAECAEGCSRPETSRQAPWSAERRAETQVVRVARDLQRRDPDASQPGGEGCSRPETTRPRQARITKTR